MHLDVSLSYALLFGVVVVLLRTATFATLAALTFIAALALGYLTAPLAISVTISLLSGQGWPAELFPLNTELGLPLWNHIIFFLVNWAIQVVGPSLRRAPRVTLTMLVGLLLLAGCTGSAGPEDVALEYGRAVYATDAEKIYRLISAEDRRVKEVAAFRRQQRELREFTKHVVGQLAMFITATPVKTTSAGNRATVTLNFKLPDANAPAIRTLMHDWDEDRVDALSKAEREQITARLTELHRTRALPMIEGEETLELVKDHIGWRVFLNWAGGVSVHFGAAALDGLPLQLTVSPEQILVTPGEHVRVTVRAKNLGSRDVTARVSHRLEPKAHAHYLALLQCPMFVPVTLKPGATEEFISEYLVLKDTPSNVKQLEGTYEFRARSDKES